jgi:TatD DNase family protein
VLAIGETGLDYYYDNSPRDVQREVFRRHLQLSQKLRLPVIIHTREADDDTEQLLRETPPAGGVIHCFTSGEKLANYVIDSGLLISFSGIVTFPKSQTLARIAARIPLDRCLVETDCPYLAPVPYRGKRNEPAFVADTAKFIAEVRRISVEEVADATSGNFLGLFVSKSS